MPALLFRPQGSPSTYGKLPFCFSASSTLSFSSSVHGTSHCASRTWNHSQEAHVLCGHQQARAGPWWPVSLQPLWMWSVLLFPHSGPARRPWGEPGPGGTAGLSWTHSWTKAELRLEPRAVGWGGALPHTPHPGLPPPAPGGQPPLTKFIHVYLLTITVKRSDC